MGEGGKGLTAAQRVDRAVALVTVLGLFAVTSGALSAVTGAAPQPRWWAFGAATVAFAAGDLALLHIRFGRSTQSFTWSETALVVGLVLLPAPWVRLAAPIGVAIAQLVFRRAPKKLAFNAASAAVGALFARTVFVALVGTPNANAPRTWAALAAASFTFWLWNAVTVSTMVALSQGLPFWSVHRKGLLLNLAVWLGNTTTGILLVAIAAANRTLLAGLPVLCGLLFLAYRSYLRAMQERDTWQRLQASSRDLLQIDRAQLSQVVLAASTELFAAEFVELLLVEPGPVVPARVSGWRRLPDGTERKVAGDPFDVASAFWGRVLSDREPFELRADDAATGQRRDLEELGLSGSFVAPLLSQDRCIGSLRVGFAGRIRLGERERQVFTTFANHVSAAVSNASLFDEMRSMALNDPLTGLPNRTVLDDRLRHALARAQRTGERVGVFFLDLDRFKVINDSLGHEVGDLLLVSVARRLTACVRPGDTVTRFGGDEFVVVCEHVEGFAELRDIAERMLTSLAQPILLAGREVVVSASVGVSTAMASAADPVELVRDADAAMYQAKEQGRARWEIFDADLRDRAMVRLETENDLRQAVERGELRLHYQPTVALNDQRVVGAEALLRWAHPARGTISPSEFIPLAEETGLIVPLGLWVLRTACQQLARWQASSIPALADLVLAVNLSPRQLADPELVRNVAEVLFESGVDPSSICLEITESALVDGGERIAALRLLRELGVRIAIDDFGTGYSALSYLHQLPVDVLKVDQSFVSRLGTSSKDLAIVAGMVDLAHAVELSVVAEGVETAAQLGALQGMGCDVAQGFYFSRPQAAEDFERTIATAAWFDGAIAQHLPT